MKVVPLNDKIVVKRLEAEEKTAGGIVLPDTAKEKPKQGKVLSVGDGKLLDNGKRAAFQVKEGDRVLFTSYAGSEVTLDGDEYLIMTEEDILAVIDYPKKKAKGKRRRYAPLAFCVATTARQPGTPRRLAASRVVSR
jgi:chaperonin GroES